MLKETRLTDFAPSLAAIVVGVSTAFILFRRNPLASLASSSGGSFDILAASLLIVAPPILFIVTKTLPSPDKWAVAFLIGGAWATLSVWFAEGVQAAANIALVLAVTCFAGIASFFLPAEGKTLLVWGPSLLLLAHQLGITILQGSLPHGFLGRGTGSIAFGHLMAIGVFVSYFLSKKSDRYGNFLFAGSAMFTIGVMLSGSRGALLGTVVGIGLILVKVYLRTGLSKTLSELRRFAILGFLTFLPLFISGIFIPGKPGGPAMKMKLIETFEISERFGHLEAPLYTAGRLEIWVTTWQEIENPMKMLFGSGKSLIDTSFGSTYPHNLFLEVALAGGLLALVPFSIFFASVFRRMYETGLNSGFDFFLFASVTLAFSMFSGDLAYNIVFFHFLGLSYGQIRKRHRDLNA
jgi:O-antigen ligase